MILSRFDPLSPTPPSILPSGALPARADDGCRRAGAALADLRLLQRVAGGVRGTELVAADGCDGAHPRGDARPWPRSAH
eukprot:2717089-Rhodomonas_salina.1